MFKLAPLLVTLACADSYVRAPQESEQVAEKDKHALTPTYVCRSAETARLSGHSSSTPRSACRCAAVA